MEEKEKMTTLKELCQKIMEEMERRGIKYPDKLYVDMKTLKTTIESIENHFIGIKQEPEDTEDFGEEELKEDDKDAMR